MLSSDLERDFPKQKLISQNSDAPHINLVVVSFSLEKLRWNIQWSAAEGPSHGVGTDWPSEVAQFDESLNTFSSTPW